MPRSKLWASRLFTIGKILLEIQKSNLSDSNGKHSYFHTAVPKKKQIALSSYLAPTDSYMGAYNFSHHNKIPDSCYLAIAY